MKKILSIAFSSITMMHIAFLLPKISNAQMAQPKEEGKSTITIAADPQYNKADGIKRFFWGDHYRKEWATPVEVEILDMDNEAGGLTPLKIGGGLQTKSLRLKGANGREYVLRSVQKDVSKAIVTELRETFAQDVVQDQVSSANPYAPMVVALLSQAAGIFHSTPRLVYVTKSDRLEEFAETFAETLCLLEERPSGNEEDNPAFGFSKNVINTEKLFDKIFKNNNHLVDEKAFAKARLFDMLIGDWDRHEDQWLWAAFQEDDKIMYKPIPRDRDQAFSKLDGLIPQLATGKSGVRKVQSFEYKIDDIKGLNMNGNHLDRNFTARLLLQDWLKAAEELQDSLTDTAIATAFREMPDAIYNISGEEIAAKLKRRRDDLQKYAKSYYEFLSEQVDITGTKNKEIFEVTRVNDDSTMLVIYNAGKYDLWNNVVYQRTFLRSETKEIRLFGLDGDDIYNVKGETRRGITIRIIGGNGNDSVTDSSSVKGMSQQTKVYDNTNTVFNSRKETEKNISSDSLKNVYNRKAFSYDWFAPVIMPGYNVDDGFITGAGFIFKKKQFGKTPYGSMQTIAGNYASATSSYSVWYKGIFKEFIGKADLHLAAKYNSPRYSRNYYGMGNETVISEEANKDYYYVRMSQVSISSSMYRQLGTKHTLSFGSEFQAVNLEENDGRYVSTEDAKIDSATFDKKKYANFQLGYEFNTIDNALFPRDGFKIYAGGRFTQNIDENDKHFIQLFSEASLFASAGRFTLATRSGAATIIGDDYEFFQAHTIGGLNYLRGYHKDRFAGKTSVYHNTELRFSLSNLNMYITKGTWGLLAFADHGRVWIPGEESNTWHHGYGGGLWFLPFNKMALTATYGVSKEDKLVSIKAGFQF
jgi:hypothetical protein